MMSPNTVAGAERSANIIEVIGPIQGRVPSRPGPSQSAVGGRGLSEAVGRGARWIEGPGSAVGPPEGVLRGCGASGGGGSPPGGGGVEMTKQIETHERLTGDERGSGGSNRGFGVVLTPGPVPPPLSRTGGSPRPPAAASCVRTSTVSPSAVASCAKGRRQ